MSDTLKKLKELTKELVPYSDLFNMELTPHIKNFKIKVGAGNIRGIYKIPEVAVGLVEFTPNTIYPTHNHPEHEYIIILSGTLHLVFEDGSIVFLKEKDDLKIEPNTTHQARSENGCKCVVITIPANPEFPTGLNT
jgi:quercetin dioxygenase-like cupin family protein